MKLRTTTSTTVLIGVVTLVASLWRTCEASSGSRVVIEPSAAAASSSSLIANLADVHQYLDDHPEKAARLRQVADLVKSQGAQLELHPKQRDLATSHENSKKHDLRTLQDDGGGDFLTNLLPLLLQILELPIFADPCNEVNNQFFDGDVVCECSGELLLSGLTFECNFAPLCADDDEQFCTTPSYRGELTLLTATAVNEVCASNVTLFGLLPVGDLCITVTLAPISEQLLQCEVSFLDLACLTCTPCPDGGLAIQCGLEPGEVPTNCLGLPGFVTQANDPDNQIDGTGDFVSGLFPVVMDVLMDAYGDP